MMNDKEILSEVLQRADEIKFKKELRRRKLYTLTSIVSSFLIILCLTFAMPYMLENINENVVSNHYATGTFFSDSNYLGYIFIGIISFILGSIVTLFCYKINNNNNNKNQHERK
ncbi:MAG: hypothetical protein R3Y40_01995 [Eubacteriales bacterium]